MKMVFTAFACALFLGACSNGIDNASSNEMPVSMQAENVTAKTYEVNSSSETLLQDPAGKLLYVPENAFEDEDGNPVSGAVTLEFTVLTELSQTVMAGITGKTSDGKLLTQEKVFRVNATQKGKQLRIRKESALSYFGEGDNDLYSGEFDQNKTFKWNQKIEPEKYLSTVPLSELNFCPEGVEPIVQQYLPFRGYNEYTPELRDSLYYSVSARFRAQRHKEGDYLTDSSSPRCGIDPADIKSLKNPKFESTLVATKEFEERITLIHRAGKRELLNVYTDKLDEHLWKLDSAAALIAPVQFKKDFQKLAAQKLGRVEKRVSSEKAKAFLEKEKERIKKEISKLEKKYQAEHQQDKRELVKLKQTYSKMLVKRHEYRLQNLGWHNEGILIPVGTFKFNIRNSFVKGDFDRIYAYLVLPEIKSLFAMQVDPKTGAITFFPEDSFFSYRTGMKIWAIAICYKDDSIYYDKIEIIGSYDLHADLTPKSISAAELNEALQYERTYKDFNKIEEDIAIREKILAKEIKIKEHERIERMMQELYQLATKCPCGPVEFWTGEKLYEGNCASCHDIDRVKVGPALRDMAKRRSLEYLTKFIRNSQKLIRDGDPYAVTLYKDYNYTDMPAYPSLTDCEIESIIEYIEDTKIEE